MRILSIGIVRARDDSCNNAGDRPGTERYVQRAIRRRRDPQAEEAGREEPVHGGVRGGVHHSAAVQRVSPLSRTGGLPIPSRWRVLIPVCMLKRFSDSPCTPWADCGTPACTAAGGPMRAYSMDLRERALLDSDAGMKAADVAAKYRVSGSWVRLLKQRRRETGEVAPRVQRHGRRPMLEPHLHTLAALIAAQPDRTLAELKDALATPASVPTVWRAVHAIGLTVRSAQPNTIGLTSRRRASRGRRRRRPGIRPTSCFWTKPASPTICSDDSGRAPRGARVHDHAPCGRWQTSTFLAALRVTGLTAPGVFDGAIDGESFRAYIEQILVPTLHPGDLVIADNLSAHKVAGIQRAIQAAGATLWYLPPYSPDLNPIELCFAKLKALVRTARWSQHRDALAVSRRVPGTLQSGRMPQLLSALRLRRCHTVMKSAVVVAAAAGGIAARVKQGKSSGA